MTLPGPGWYQDPGDPAQQRWWSGAEWTAHQQPQIAPAPVQHTGYVPMSGFSAHQGYPAYDPNAPTQFVEHEQVPLGMSNKARSARDRHTRRVNPFGWTGLLLAVIGILFFALCGLLGSIAVVFGGVGLARASKLAKTGAVITGFGVSLAAVIVGGFDFAHGILLLPTVFSSFMEGFNAGLNGTR